MKTDTPDIVQHDDLAEKPLAEIRRLIRAGHYTGQTSGLALGMLQGNLAILPQQYALDFARFCQRNPKPCPLVGVSDTGDPMLRTLGADIDVRTDVPSFNIYREGELVDQAPDLMSLWREDLVVFVLGCSFSFEEAVMATGVRLRHIERGCNVAMYRTNIETVPAGSFHGGMVVSMRPLTARDAVTAVEVSNRFPHAHGTPIHLGDPTQIGIVDLGQPDWGDLCDIQPDEIPVFWACGVTPQEIIRNAKPELCITHTPGSMLITDLLSSQTPGSTLHSHLLA